MKILRILVPSTVCTQTLPTQAPIHSFIVQKRLYPDNDHMLNVVVMFARSFMDTILLGMLFIENTPSLKGFRIPDAVP
jgi:hypothetical protein